MKISQKKKISKRREKIIFVTIATKINEMKIMKIDTCKFENNLFDDALIIVDCTLNLEKYIKLK
jgi:hypothetical protein